MTTPVLIIPGRCLCCQGNCCSQKIFSTSSWSCSVVFGGCSPDPLCIPSNITLFQTDPGVSNTWTGTDQCSFGDCTYALSVSLSCSEDNWILAATLTTITNPDPPFCLDNVSTNGLAEETVTSSGCNTPLTINFSGEAVGSCSTFSGMVEENV